MYIYEHVKKKNCTVHITLRRRFLPLHQYIKLMKLHPMVKTK